MLGATGLAEDARVIVEKPFGRDLASAQRSTPPSTTSSTSRRSSASTTSSARSRSRTSSRSASPTGCSSRSGTATTSSHVQIDVPETVGVEGRGAFYEETGAVPGHDPHPPLPVAGLRGHGAPDLRSRRAVCGTRRRKVFEAHAAARRPAQVVRGQYDGLPRRAADVDPESTTETFVALRVVHRQLAVGRRALLPPHGQGARPAAPDRDAGVPGARAVACSRSPRSAARRPRNNALMIDFDDPGRIAARFLAKEPGPDHAPGRGRQ